MARSAIHLDEHTRSSRNRVPLWATIAANVVPLCVLPSALWRTEHGLHVLLAGPGRCGVQSDGEAIYVVGLSLVSLSLAGLTPGLVQRRGEVLPRWIPVVGGKSLPPRLVAVSSAALASAVGLLVSYYVIKEALGLDIGTSRPLPDGCSAPDLSVLVFYVPLIAWAPLLFLLTQHYYRRRISNANSSEA